MMHLDWSGGQHLSRKRKHVYVCVCFMTLFSRTYRGPEHFNPVIAIKLKCTSSALTKTCLCLRVAPFEFTNWELFRMSLIQKSPVAGGRGTPSSSSMRAEPFTRMYMEALVVAESKPQDVPNGWVCWVCFLVCHVFCLVSGGGH